MTTGIQQSGGGVAARPNSSGLADVIDTILDKGLVIDAYVRVSLVGIELLTIDARVVVAGVDTYLRFAEAVNRLDIKNDDSKSLPEFLEGAQESGAEKKVKGGAKGAIGAAGDSVRDFLGGDKDERRPSHRSNGSRRGEDG